jgi:hypothetical protein
MPAATTRIRRFGNIVNTQRKQITMIVLRTSKGGSVHVNLF